MALRSRNKTALITGASIGIGAVYADRLARRGFDLVLVARNRERLEQFAAQLEYDTGAMVDSLSADLNDPAGLACVEDVLRTDGSIDMLVNNAGIGFYAPTLETDMQVMQNMIALNVTALTRLTYAAATAFVARGAGSIINISSAVAVAPDLLNGVYGGTKAYVLALSQALRQELTGKGVRVQVVLPGAIATDFWKLAGKPVEELPSSAVMSADDLVDAALAGFDLGEFVTVPSLPDVGDWQAFEDARTALRPNLSLARPAPRYSTVSKAEA
jgi:uncharacterized protein